MSESSQSPEYQSRPFDFSRSNPCAQIFGQDAFGSSGSFQVPHGVLSDPSRLYNKSCYGGIPSTSAQTFFPFPSVTSDYRASELQHGDFGQPKHWFPFTDYTGQLPGVPPVIQPINLSTFEADTGEQFRLPEIKLEKNFREDYPYSAEAKVQQYLSPQASNEMPHGLFYPRTGSWNPSFWSLSSPGRSSQTSSTPSTYSPSLPPSPPCNGNAFFNVSTPQDIPEPQPQKSTSSRRNAASSPPECKNSEVSLYAFYFFLYKF